MTSGYSFRDLSQPGLNETLKVHNYITFKMVKTVSEFSQKLATVHEQHANELKSLVETFRKRTSDLRKERMNMANSLFCAWEAILGETEMDIQLHLDIASSLTKNLCTNLVDRTSYRKTQAKKIFSQRENFDALINKSEEVLLKCYKDYVEAYQKYSKDMVKTSYTASYYNAHNAYVLQLQAYNRLLEEYNTYTLPQLLDELEDIYIDLSYALSNAILEEANIMSIKTSEQSRRYEGVANVSRLVHGKTDLSFFAKSLEPDPAAMNGRPQSYQVPDPTGSATEDLLPNELVMENTSDVTSKPRYDQLYREAGELETQIKQIQESLDGITGLQQRSLENHLYNKALELQEDISKKRYDIRMATLQLVTIRAQMELFSNKNVNDVVAEKDKEQKSLNTSIKNRWLKAFKSLKTGGLSSKKEERAEGTERAKKDSKLDLSFLESTHQFQEYTFRKITLCDICGEVLRGVVKQGVKCKYCKINAHVDCQERATKCQSKRGLLRRQRSTSEIDTKVLDEPQEIDPIYELLKQAAARGSAHASSSGSSSTVNSISSAVSPRRHKRSSTSPLTQSSGGNTLTVVNPRPSRPVSDNVEEPDGERIQVGLRARCKSIDGPIQTPHSPQRQRLSLRMKSISLDSPDAREQVHVHQRKIRPQQSQSSHSSHSQSPQSPVQTRRLLVNPKARQSSLDLPDENEKSLSSASVSPCPSPISCSSLALIPKHHERSGSGSYFIATVNFKGRAADELDLIVGSKVYIQDATDSHWWKGISNGKEGYFPSKYVTRLMPGEKALIVTHTLTVSEGDLEMKLLKDQIVIQMGEEEDGMIPIRLGDQLGICPIKYLQEIS